MGTIGMVAYYVLIAKTFPNVHAWCKRRKKDPLFPSSEEDEDSNEYHERVERDIEKERVKVRKDMELQQQLKEDLGME